MEGGGGRGGRARGEGEGEGGEGERGKGEMMKPSGSKYEQNEVFLKSKK